MTHGSDILSLSVSLDPTLFPLEDIEIKGQGNPAVTLPAFLINYIHSLTIPKEKEDGRYQMQRRGIELSQVPNTCDSHPHLNKRPHFIYFLP